MHILVYRGPTLEAGRCASQAAASRVLLVIHLIPRLSNILSTNREIMMNIIYLNMNIYIIYIYNYNVCIGSHVYTSIGLSMHIPL